MKTSAKQIAQRYVQALFDAAKGDALAAVEKDFAAFSQALAHDETLAHFLANPLLSREQQKEALEAVLKKMDAHDITSRFLMLLVDNKRLSLFSDIMEIFARRVSESRDEMSAEIISAAPLSPQEVAAVSDQLGRTFKKKVLVEGRLDPSLLGGLVVKVGSLQLDSSLSGKIDRLKLALKAA